MSNTDESEQSKQQVGEQLMKASLICLQQKWHLWGGLAGREGVPSRTCLDGLGVGRRDHAGCPTLHSRIPMRVGMGVSLASDQASEGSWIGACPSRPQLAFGGRLEGVTLQHSHSMMCQSCHAMLCCATLCCAFRDTTDNMSSIQASCLTRSHIADDVTTMGVLAAAHACWIG